MYETIPQELKDRQNWCVFKMEWQEERGKYTKLPYNPFTGQKAKSNDPDTWCTFEVVMDFKDNYDGIGFFFDGDYFGVDLDGVSADIDRYHANELENNIVADFVDTLQSYAEISPSGTGVHVICRGTLPSGGRRKGNVEMYGDGRFFTMTGNNIGGYFDIHDDRTDHRINALHEKYIGANAITARQLSKAEFGHDLNTNEIIERALQSKDEPFRLCFTGGWEQVYQGHSEADLALANSLAFWCARDFEKMDIIFRQSDLMRDKWDEKRRDKTYGELTLQKAIDECFDIYQPEEKAPFKIKNADEILKPTAVRLKHYSYDDMGNTERFLDKYRETVLYNVESKNWYFYNNKYWAEDEKLKIEELADHIAEVIKKEPIHPVSDPNDEKLIEQARKGKAKHLEYTRKYSGRQNMINDVKHHLAVSLNDFDANPNLMNFSNGYLDLTTQKFYLHDEDSRKLMFTRMSNTEYREDGDCPLWKKFLKQTFKDDHELIDYVQRCVGYSMIGSTEEQRMFILLGNGRNGKSVFLNILNEVFGKYAMNITPKALSFNKSNSPNTEVARLKGARLVTTTEPDASMRFDEGLVKQLTGGDKVTARFLYKGEFEYTPEFTIWMATNHKPIIRGTDDGIWRRISVIPFDNNLNDGEADPKLFTKLKAELPYIAKWCVEGYVKWKQVTIREKTEPERVKEHREDYRNEMDVFVKFVDECCDVGPTYKATAKELWDTFQVWVKDNNEYDGHTRHVFGREISKAFKKKKSDGVFVYQGLKLKTNTAPFKIRNIDGVE